jgi:hypothetical protein
MPNSDDPRDRIPRAAATLFAPKGYAGTSAREITEAARVANQPVLPFFRIESLVRNHPDLVQLSNAFLFSPPSEETPRLGLHG